MNAVDYESDDLDDFVSACDDDVLYIANDDDEDLDIAVSNDVPVAVEIDDDDDGLSPRFNFYLDWMERSVGPFLQARDDLEYCMSCAKGHLPADDFEALVQFLHDQIPPKRFTLA